MKSSIIRTTLGLLSCSCLGWAQTFTNCNPLENSCPSNPALGKSATFDFTKGYSSEFDEVGGPTYDSNGVGFTVAKQGDSPLLQSKWYIMFGRVEYVIKAAPGTGIVSSAVLQSDDLDEIDWEWLGGNNALVQSNYFGKGNTNSFNRGATHDNPGNHDSFHTYTIDWTSKQIVWKIDDKTVRVLTPDTAQSDQYPQTPMMVKVGVWAGGDPDNAQGTIDWAGGVTDYSAGPYTMYMKSLKVTDYSTGKSYTYGDRSGSWESINAEGGEINGNIDADTASRVESAPTVTATVDSIPIPFSGTHRETSSFERPSIWPWVPTPTTLSTGAAMTGLPSGWTFSSSGQVQPPGAASCSSQSISVWSHSLPASAFLSVIKTSPTTLITTPTLATFRSDTPGHNPTNRAPDTATDTPTDTHINTATDIPTNAPITQLTYTSPETTGHSSPTTNMNDSNTGGPSPPAPTTMTRPTITTTHPATNTAHAAPNVDSGCYRAVVPFPMAAGWVLLSSVLMII